MDQRDFLVDARFRAGDFLATDLRREVDRVDRVVRGFARAARLFAADERFLEEDELRRLELRLGFGTLAPERRASDKPIAIACFRLFTLLPDLPLFNVPRLRSCIALFTLLCACLP